MTESKIQAKIMLYLKACPDTYAFKVMKASTNGVPDIIACVQGKFIALEVKSEKGRPSKLQIVAQRRIKEAGGESYIVRSVEEVQEIIQLALTGEKNG